MNQEQLLKILLQCGMLQEYVDETARVLDCPYWIMDEGFHLSAISHKPDATSLSNQYLRDTTLMESVKRWEKFQVFSDETHLEPYRFRDDFLNRDVMIMDILVRNNPVGRVTFFPQHEMDEASIRLTIQGAATYLRTTQHDTNHDMYQQAFASLLRGEDPESFAEFLESEAPGLEPPFQIFCISAENRGRLFAYSSSIREIDAWTLPIVTQSALYVLSSAQHPIGQIQNQLPGLGKSFPFEDLRKIRSYGMQALYASRHGNQIVLKDYDLYLLSQTADPESLISPKVRACMNYDLSYQTHYFDTLCSYLRHGENKQAVSEELGVHLNTVRYRLDQLKNLFEIDLETERTEIFLSCIAAEYLNS